MRAEGRAIKINADLAKSNIEPTLKSKCSPLSPVSRPIYFQKYYL